MLPIVQRELRTAVRHPKFYKWRIRLAVIELIAAFFIVAGQGRGRGNFFWFFSWIAFLFCLFEGLRKTSDAISEEKREGTLGFLFLTDLKGFDVILGKLVGAMLRSFNVLLIFVPILAITLIVGGTTLGEFWRTVLALGNTLWFSLAVCLFASSFSREKYLGASFGVIASFTIVPIIIGQFLQFGHVAWARSLEAVSPVMNFLNASDAYYSNLPGPYWIGLAAQNFIGWLTIIAASLIIPYAWQDRVIKAGSRVRARTFDKSEKALALRREFLDRNPILWLAYSGRLHRNFNILFYTVLILCLVATSLSYSSDGKAAGANIFSLLVLTLLFFIHVASQSSINLAEAKRTGAMELLLSTPMKVANIVQGQWLALKRIFLIPAVILFTWYFVFLLLSYSSEELGAFLYVAKFVGEFVLGFFVIAWTGMWMGLTSKTPNRAFFRTILVGLIVPYIVCLPTLVNQVVLLLIAYDKVKYNFRRFIAERYLQAPGFILPPALASQPNTPPVIR